MTKQDAPTVQELTIDGHKGEEAIRRYVATMARTQVLNQWLADVYCNELRKIYTAQFAYDARDERDAEIRANNKIADLWRQRKDYLKTTWPVEYVMEYAETFPAEHCKVTEALMASLHEFVPPKDSSQAATSAAGGATGDLAAFKNFHRSLCARFGYTHDDRYWWRDLVSLEEHIAALAAQSPTEAAAMAATVPAKPVAYWIEKAEQFCLPSKDGTRPFDRNWQPLYAAPQAPVAGQPAEPSPADLAPVFHCYFENSHPKYMRDALPSDMNESLREYSPDHADWLVETGHPRNAAMCMRRAAKAIYPTEFFVALAAPKGDSNG